MARVKANGRIEDIPDIWLAGFCMANKCTVQAAVEWWLRQSEMARQSEMEYECAYCEEKFTAEPVRDPHAVAWFGLEWAQIWCSEECMVKYAERAASNEPLGRGDLR
jgi:hypothetical protein